MSVHIFGYTAEPLQTRLFQKRKSEHDFHGKPSPLKDS